MFVLLVARVRGRSTTLEQLRPDASGTTKLRHARLRRCMVWTCAGLQGNCAEHRSLLPSALAERQRNACVKKLHICCRFIWIIPVGHVHGSFPHRCRNGLTGLARGGAGSLPVAWRSFRPLPAVVMTLAGDAPTHRRAAEWSNASHAAQRLEEKAGVLTPNQVLTRLTTDF